MSGVIITTLLLGVVVNVIWCLARYGFGHPAVRHRQRPLEFLNRQPVIPELGHQFLDRLSQPTRDDPRLLLDIPNRVTGSCR
jgi:hypothetical protein